MVMMVALRFFQATVLLSATQYAVAYTPSSSMMSNNSPRWSSSSLFSTTAHQDVDGTALAASSAEDDTNDHISTRDLLSLDYIRSTLIRQEETIIFALIERAQFRQNRKVYEKGGVPGLEGDTSFLDFMLSGTVSDGESL